MSHRSSRSVGATLAAVTLDVTVIVTLVVTLGLLAGCSGAPSRNILGSYFPSWMVCALGGIAAGLIARAIFKATGLLEEIPMPFVVILAIVCAATFALWLAWLA